MPDDSRAFERFPSKSENAEGLVPLKSKGSKGGKYLQFGDFAVMSSLKFPTNFAAAGLNFVNLQLGGGQFI